MKTTYNRVSAMNSSQRGALSEQFDKAARISGAEPIGIAMMIWAACNAALNLVCLKLLRSHRDEGAHFAASWIFTSNDTLVNLGIVVSGALVDELVVGAGEGAALVGGAGALLAGHGRLLTWWSLHEQHSRPAPWRCCGLPVVLLWRVGS